MKLVEILARELEVWPESCERISQLSTRGLLIDTRIHDGNLDLAEDWDRSTITRPQWQAERDRMKAMETQQATASTEPTYEQQLWDRVAERAFFRVVDLEIETSQGHTTEFIAKFSADQADAFMAERAKRVGK